MDFFLKVRNNIYFGVVALVSRIFAILHFLLRKSAFLRACYYKALPRQIVAATHDDMTFVLNSGDQVIAQEIFVHGSFDLRKAQRAFALAKFDSEKSIFVDVGANIGSICLPILKHKFAESAVAIEPDALNFSLLRANSVLNGLDDRVTCHNMAVGARENEILTFELSDENYGDHRISLGQSAGQFNEQNRKTVQVKSTKLDVVLDEIIDGNLFIWMDTQGFEGYILSGAENVLSRSFPMVLEFWPYGMERAKSYDLLKSAVLGAKYRVFYDLGELNPVAQPLTAEALDRLHAALAARGTFTDILLTR